MVDEPADPMLRLLRDIREEVSAVRKVQDQHSVKFVEISHRLGEIHESLYTSLGMSAHANIRHDSVQQQLDELKARIERLEQNV